MIHSEAFLRLVDDAKTRVREITVEEVFAKLQRKDDFLFLDVREDREWEQGRAEGSIHLGRGVLERDIEQIVPDKNKELVLYCGGGYRSALAGDMLQRMGYARVWSMAGGIRVWREKKLPISR